MKNKTLFLLKQYCAKSGTCYACMVKTVRQQNENKLLHSWAPENRHTASGSLPGGQHIGLWQTTGQELLPAEIHLTAPAAQGSPPEQPWATGETRGALHTHRRPRSTMRQTAAPLAICELFLLGKSPGKSTKIYNQCCLCLPWKGKCFGGEDYRVSQTLESVHVNTTFSQ